LNIPKEKIHWKTSSSGFLVFGKRSSLDFVKILPAFSWWHSRQKLIGEWIVDDLPCLAIKL
jgi:hypothetical protein